MTILVRFPSLDDSRSGCPPCPPRRIDVAAHFRGDRDRDAAASAYLHPLATQTQVRHILGAAVHAARAGELSRGDDPVVAEYMLDAAARRMSLTVREVLARYPRAPRGRTRVASAPASVWQLPERPPGIGMGAVRAADQHFVHPLRPTSGWRRLLRPVLAKMDFR